MTHAKTLTQNEWLNQIKQNHYSAQKNYRAMYSSWWKGIVTDPQLMMIPIDDHGFHRGDGVFEAIKILNERPVLVKEHIQRLLWSAEKIGLKHNYTEAEIYNLLKETVKASGLETTMIRMFISRGPGGFTTNPYECIGGQLHIVATEYKPLAEEKYEQGVKVGISQVKPKESWLAQAKTCNYLPNVMMKKEAVDQALDFTVGFDHAGFLTESSTENMVILTTDRKVLRPVGVHILKGLTMSHCLTLVTDHLDELNVRSVLEKDISMTDILNAEEVMMMGTTLDVLPVREFNGKLLQGAENGFSFSKKLLSLYKEFIKKQPLL